LLNQVTLCLDLPRSAGFQTGRIADFQVGWLWKKKTLEASNARRFGNPRYGASSVLEVEALQTV